MADGPFNEMWSVLGGVNAPPALGDLEKLEFRNPGRVGDPEEAGGELPSSDQQMYVARPPGMAWRRNDTAGAISANM